MQEVTLIQTTNDKQLKAELEQLIKDGHQIEHIIKTTSGYIVITHEIVKDNF